MRIFQGLDELSEDAKRFARIFVQLVVINHRSQCFAGTILHLNVKPLCPLFLTTPWLFRRRWLRSLLCLPLLLLLLLFHFLWLLPLLLLLLYVLYFALGLMRALLLLVLVLESLLLS